MKILAAFLILLVSSLVFAGDVLATEASFKCSPSTGTFKVGETFNVDYILDTRNFPVNGGAAIATYDPAAIEVVGTQSTPETGSTKWGQPTTNSVDTSLGKITLDYGNSQPTWTGSGSIGKITFKAKATGQAQFNWVFFQQYDDTTPGVAKAWGKKTEGASLTNILTDVNNCIYVISGTTPTPTNKPAGPTNTPLPTVPPVTELPRAGTAETTVSYLGIAGIFLAIGSLMPRFLLKDKKNW